MIIPIKCFTCGKVLADLYRWYLRRVRELKMANSGGHEGGGLEALLDESKVRYFAKGGIKTEEGQVLDELNLDLQCCRRHMLTHVDID